MKCSHRYFKDIVKFIWYFSFMTIIMISFFTAISEKVLLKSRTRIEYLNLYLNLILDLSNEQWRKRLRRPWTREKTQFKLWRQIKKHKDTNDLHLIEAKTEKRIKINQICNFDSCMAEVYIRASSVSQWHPVGYSSRLDFHISYPENQKSKRHRTKTISFKQKTLNTSHSTRMKIEQQFY